MNANETELNYRGTAMQEATPADLVVILYDMLVGDLRQAIDAMRNEHVEDRSIRLKHALAILQLLEGSLDMENGGITAQHLSQFYSHIRRQMLVAQFGRNPDILQQQITLLLDVREAWQQVGSSGGTRESSNPATGFMAARADALTTATDGRDWCA
jgi:flagellar protein FliS